MVNSNSDSFIESFMVSITLIRSNLGILLNDIGHTKDRYRKRD